MATAIITWVAKLAGSYIFNEVKNGLFGQAADKMDVLIRQQQEIKHTIETLALENRIYEACQHIMDWTIQLKEKLGVAGRGLPQELDKFIADIGNANIGVHYALSNLYNGLLGQTGTGNGRRLLDVWHENAYRRLADANDLNYTIPNYVDDMDTKLEAVLELIRNGLILLIMTTKDQPQANSWSREWEGKMQGLLQIVYNNYPPALKYFKPTYDSRWQPTIWYQLQLRGRPSQLYRRFNGSIAIGSESGSDSQWQFNPTVEHGLVGLLGRDGNRLKIETYYAGGMSGAMEEMRRGVTVVFKLIPLINVNEPVIQLAGPFRESDRYKYDCRANKDMGVVIPFHDWILHKV